MRAMIFERKKQKEADLLQGNALKQILCFSVPLMGGNLLTQLYNLADAAIVGHFVGVDAFAAVSCTGWVVWLLSAVCRDSSNAISIMGAYQIGAKCPETFKRVMATAFYVGTVLTLLTCIPLLVAMDGVLRLNQVPGEIYGEAKTYLAIYALGIPFCMICSMASAILRAAGNSRIPFLAMAVSAVINIGLDLLFVAVLQTGVAGAAWATFLAQGISAVIAFCGLLGQGTYHMQSPHWKPDPDLCREAVSLWLPMFWNSVVITAGGIYVQAFINGAGAAFSAGYMAAVKVFNVIEGLLIAVQTALSVFIGQNLGAAQVQRIRKGFRDTLLAALFFMTLTAVGIWFAGGPLIGVFLSSKDPTAYQIALETGQRQIRCMMIGTPVMIPMYFCRSGMQALGYSGSTLAAGFVQMAARVLVVAVLTPCLGTVSCHLTDPAAWIVSLPVVAIPFLRQMKKLEESRTTD